MGLGRAFLLDLMELKRRGLIPPGARRVIEIGAQQLADALIDAPELQESFRLFDCSSNLTLRPVGAENFTTQAPSARPFWLHLGFDHTAIDIDGDALRLDLNRDTAPKELCGAFDLLVNAGTTEHIANQEDAFRVIHDLTRKGGIMYHEVPAGGMFDHGLVNYQPKFFTRLSRQNDYEVVLFKPCSWGPSPVPDYIREFNRRFGGTLVESFPDLSLRVAFQKLRDAPFSSPIDAAEHLIPRPKSRSRLWPTRMIAQLIKYGVKLRYNPAGPADRSSVIS